jgi:hypothetical protein
MRITGAIIAAMFIATGAGAQVPGTGIGPAPTGVVPGGVVPVPAPSTTPTPDLTPPNPIPAPIGVSPAPSLPGQRPNGTSAVNTFNEQQIRSSLMAQGYTGISGLSVDGSGTWRGTAVRNGANVSVMIDSNGIITPG